MIIPYGKTFIFCGFFFLHPGFIVLLPLKWIAEKQIFNKRGLAERMDILQMLLSKKGKFKLIHLN